MFSGMVSSVAGGGTKNRTDACAEFKAGTNRATVYFSSVVLDRVTQLSAAVTIEQLSQIDVDAKTIGRLSTTTVRYTLTSIGSGLPAGSTLAGSGDWAAGADSATPDSGGLGSTNSSSSLACPHLQFYSRSITYRLKRLVRLPVLQQELRCFSRSCRCFSRSGWRSRFRGRFRWFFAGLTGSSAGLAGVSAGASALGPSAGITSVFGDSAGAAGFRASQVRLTKPLSSAGFSVLDLSGNCMSPGAGAQRRRSMISVHQEPSSLRLVEDRDQEDRAAFLRLAALVAKQDLQA